MQHQLPGKKIARIALLTSLLLGLFGATPSFSLNEFSLYRTCAVFISVTLFTLFTWVINTGLLQLSYGYKWLDNYKIRFAMSFLLCIATALLLLMVVPPPKHFPNPEMHSLPRMPKHSFRIFPLIQSLSINIIVSILLELILLKETKNKMDIENEQLRSANLEARNNQLVQQLHPHFLFNSLSTLKALINKSPVDAADYLDKLSELLRFSTNNSQQALVNVGQELELCTNYLNMQKTRFGEALHFRIDIPVDQQQAGKLPVYSLQQLAENAIKHNVLTRASPLFIQITQTENGDAITVRNNLQPKQQMVAGSGLGLANLSERYRLLGEDDIVVTKGNDSFAVSLKILEHESTYN